VPGGPRGLQNRRRFARAGIGSIPILSANFSREEVNRFVARTNPSIDVAFVLCWLSCQVEPTGPVASFASATNLSEPQRSRELEHVR
jgi:hypothetical protein